MQASCWDFAFSQLTNPGFVQAGGVAPDDVGLGPEVVGVLEQVARGERHKGRHRARVSPNSRELGPIDLVSIRPGQSTTTRERTAPTATTPRAPFQCDQFAIDHYEQPLVAPQLEQT